MQSGKHYQARVGFLALMSQSCKMAPLGDADEGFMGLYILLQNAWESIINSK